MGTHNILKILLATTLSLGFFVPLSPSSPISHFYVPLSGFSFFLTHESVDLLQDSLGGLLFSSMASATLISQDSQIYTSQAHTPLMMLELCIYWVIGHLHHLDVPASLQ